MAKPAKHATNKRLILWIAIFLVILLAPFNFYGSLLIFHSSAVPLWGFLIGLGATAALIYHDRKSSTTSPVIGFAKITMFLVAGLLIFSLAEAGIYASLFSVHSLNLVTLAAFSAIMATLLVFIWERYSHKSN